MNEPLTTHIEGRKIITALAVATAMVLIATVATVLTAVRLFTEDDTFTPYGEFPVQQVTEVTDLFVRVEAVKCTVVDEPITSRATIFWDPLDPNGVSLPLVTDFDYVLEPGCTTFNFENSIPDEVSKRNARLADDCSCVPIWRISGSETAIDDNGGEGQVRQITSTNFTLDPDVSVTDPRAGASSQASTGTVPPNPWAAERRDVWPLSVWAWPIS